MCTFLFSTQENWFKFQFGDNEWVNVLRIVYLVVSRQTPKKRTLWFHGPPNSGKTYVFESLCTLFILYGQIENTTVKKAFPFQDLYQKYINLFNEFTLPADGSQDNQYKIIFEGRQLLVDLKHVKSGLLEGGANIILTNSSITDNIIDITKPEWEVRIYKYFV